MTISAELQRIYSSAPVNITFYNALYLSHPNWAEPLAYITNTVEERTFKLNGADVLYKPASFTIRLPARNDLGIVEFSIDFPMTSTTVDNLDLAENSGEPITAILTTYIDSSLDPQMEPVQLQIDKVSMTAESGTATAQRIDLINRAYPRNIVRALTYRGLLR